MKIKTCKSISKRYRVTKNGKIIKRTNGQGHYNARENGKTGRNKKSDTIVSQALKNFMEVAMPNS